MKKRYIAMFLIVFVSVALTCVSMFFLPDTIPMHYNLAGEIDRYGNKLEAFLLPFISGVTGIFIMLSSKLQKKEGSKNNEKVFATTGCVIMAFMLVLQAAILIKTLSAVGAITTEIDMIKILAAGIGLLLIVLGNIMPKAEKNHFFGIRTASSMKNERTWRKSQRMGAYITIAAGVACILCSVIFSGNLGIIVLIGVLIVYIIASFLGSYIIYRADAKRNKQGE